MTWIERWAPRVGVAATLALATVGFIGVVVVPGTFLLVRPFVAHGLALLTAIVAVFGLGAAGMLAAGLASWQQRRTAPGALPRTLVLGSAAAMVAALPPLAWGWWLWAQLGAGRDLGEAEVAVLLTTALLHLPLLVALIGAGAFVCCRRRAATWRTAGSASRRGPRAIWATVGALLVTAMLCPGGMPAARTTALVGERTPHDWIRRLATDHVEAAMRALLAAGNVAVPDVAAALNAQQGLRWAVASGLRDAVAYGSLEVRLRRLVALDPPVVPVAALLARRHGAAAAPLAPALLRLPRHELWIVDDAALALLRRVGARASPELRAAVAAELASSDPHRRAFAAYACLRLGPEAGRPIDDLLPRFLEALASSDGDAQFLAAQALAELGAAASRAVPALIRALDGGASIVHGRARDALIAIGRSDPTVAGRLQAALQAGTVEPTWTMEALCELRHATPAVLDRLRSELDSTGDGAESWALTWAARLGSAGAPLLPAIVPKLSDADIDIRLKAARAGIAIEGPTPERLAVVRSALQSGDEHALRAAIDVLWDLPEIAPEFETELRACLGHPDEQLPLDAAGVLLQASLALGLAQAVLARALRGESGGSALWAAFVCRRLGPAARPVLPALRAFRDGSGYWIDVAYDAVDAVEGTGGR